MPLLVKHPLEGFVVFAGPASDDEDVSRLLAQAALRLKPAPLA
jgi:hypothetical protein